MEISAIIASLERLDPKSPLCETTIKEACSQIRDLNRKTRSNLVNLLSRKNYGKWADGLNGAYKAENKKLLNSYFSNKAYSYEIPHCSPEPLDGPRASLVFHICDELQNLLLDHLEGLPTAKVNKGSQTPNSDHFDHIFRYAQFCQMVSAIKWIQADIDHFSFLSEYLLSEIVNGFHSYRSSTWPFDPEIFHESTLLGFFRAPCPHILNSIMLSSPVIAGCVVRSYLESVLFRIDFQSSLNNSQQPEATTWEDALRFHKNSGKLTMSDEMWIKKTYDLLSGVLHSGFLLTRGEIWMMSQLVDQVRSQLK